MPDGGPNPVFAAYDRSKGEQAASALAAPAPVAEPARKSEERIILIIVIGVVALAGLLVLAVVLRGRPQR